jgi:hypothetical protein
MPNLRNTIILGPCSGPKDEAIALDGTIKPGMLVDIDAAGKAIKHGTVDGFGSPTIAIEDALQGKTTADAYPINTPVFFHHFERGAKVQLLCAIANYAIGAKLVSAGNGTFQAAGAGTKQVFAVVREAKNVVGAPALVVAKIV